MIQPTATTKSRFETDAPETTTASYDPVVIARITWWGAIIAGALTAMSLMAIFAVLGTAIGLSVISATNDTPEEGLSIGAAIYWLITGLIALFLGGWLASYLRRTVDTGVGALHGFLAWCTVTVVSSVLLAMAGGTAIGGSLAAVGDAMQANNQNIVQRSVRDNGNRDGDSVYEKQAKDAAKKAAGASWWTFAALVLGASVASLAGAAASRKNDYDRTHQRTPRTTVVDSSSRPLP